MTSTDRRWLELLADSLDRAARTHERSITGESATTIRLTDTFVRNVADRLRAILERDAIPIP
jgi:hypothetical protein